MIRRFIPEALQIPKAKVELKRERGHYVTDIKNPTPNPKDRIVDEYGDDDNSA
jgi:hypothetical protein